MAALVARMRAAAREAGLDDDGPLTPLLQALALALEHLAALSDRNARRETEHKAELRQILTVARQASEAETACFRAGLDTTKTEVIREIAGKIAKSADAALTRRVRVFDRNSALITAGVLVVGLIGALGGGYWWGSRHADAAIYETEAGLRAAFEHGPEAARLWLNWMRWNDPKGALAQCSGNALSRQGGRLGCMVPLWIEDAAPAGQSLNDTPNNPLRR